MKRLRAGSLVAALLACALDGCSQGGTSARSGDGGLSSDGASTASGGASAGGTGARGAGTGAGGGGTPGSGGEASAGGTASAGGGTTGSGGGVSTGGATSSGDAGSPTAADEGDVHVVKRTGDPSFDAVVTNPSPDTVTWLQEHFYRMEVFTPFFDGRTSFYANGLVYWDSQVIYPGSTTAQDHPDWILKDSGGKFVYLDWGCSNGSCPQFAADVTNAAFRASWIASLNSALANGYRGAWIDDVNLDTRFSNGNQPTTAYSPASGTAITDDAWAAAIAAFMAEVRTEITGYELLHNSIWYARPTRTDDVSVRAEIQAADWINMEGGFASDAGLTGGTGPWSVFAKMAFADTVHAAGRAVVVDDFPSNDTERQYALACYLLLSNGKDGLGDFAMSPSTWWPGYDVRLGKALGPRSRDASGLFTRDFEHGKVLMLEPSAASRTIQLSGSYVAIGGADVSQVTLSAKQGAVLVAR